MASPHAFPIEANWRTVLRDLRVRPEDVLRRARLPEDLLARPGASLPTEDYFRLWESLAAEAGGGAFAVTLVEVVSSESFSPPLFAALSSPNLLVAAQRLSAYKRLIAPIALDIGEQRDAVTMTFRWLDASVPVPPSLAVFEMAFLVRLARLATREALSPLTVTTLSPPEPAADYRRYFGVPVEKQKAHAITFSRADAERPFLTANEAMWRVFEPELRRRLSELDASAGTAERVKAVLLQALPSGQVSMEEVAARLASSKRTLQRRLSEEGVTFQDVLARTREELARHYLTRTQLSCTEISFLLAFEDPNSFFRAFHAWTGSTPEGLRGSLATA